MKRLKKILTRKIIIWLVLLLFILTTASFFILSPVKSILFLRIIDDASLNNQFWTNLIIFDCSWQQKRKIDCYDDKIASLAEQIDLEKAFEITKEIELQDDNYKYCHVVAHKIAAAEVRKDPDNWKEVINRCPVNQCANGCIHGVFQEKYKVENLSSSQIDLIKSEFKNICAATAAWQPTSNEQSSCYHALGHLFVYMSNADIDKSINLCDEITPNDNQMSRFCYEGAFMQVFQILEPEDIALVKNIKPTSTHEAVSFCSDFKHNPLAHASCINQSWPLSIKQLKQNPVYINEFCKDAEPDLKKLCTGPVISIMPIQFNFNQSKLLNYCQALPDNMHQDCINIVASRMITSDGVLREKAVNFCVHSPEKYQEGCFITLISELKNEKILNSENKSQICRLFPEDFTYSCLY